jgi:hypothetical protein
MFWWEMMAPIAPETIETTFKLMEYRHLDPSIVIGPFVKEIMKFASLISGISLPELANKIYPFTRGITLESVSTYTYRTPFYQLSGIQDRDHRGMNGFQEHHWQATLDKNAYIFTSSPGGLGFNRFTGGWQPKTVFYKNVGIIQYDRVGDTAEVNTINLLANIGLNMVRGDRPYNHAYFPKWAFDEVLKKGNWIFGMKNNGYVALYSQNPTFWVSDYELWSWGQKNLWIVELGDVYQYNTFANFTDVIFKNHITCNNLKVGYDVTYSSKSIGLMNVRWEDSLKIDGIEPFSLPYKRYDNKYCTQEFGTNTTQIEFDDSILILDFDNCIRDYTIRPLGEY